LHYAGNIKPGAAHFKDEDANLIATLIDYGGQTELQSYEDMMTPMHLAAKNGNEAVLLAIVNKIGAGMVQIVQNKKSKVICKNVYKFLNAFAEWLESFVGSMRKRTRWCFTNFTFASCSN
jgi:hypothetical protein